MYKLHCFESPTGLKFVLMTDPLVGNIKDILRNIYSQIYVEFVAKNPLTIRGNIIQCELFKINLNRYISSLPFFQT